jgi:predicted nucleotidyltransferase
LRYSGGVAEGCDMSAVAERFELTVTPAKVEELVRRIVDAVSPVAVIAFGSRARGEHSSDSDIDIAVIVDGTESNYERLPEGLTAGLALDVDLLTVPQERFDRYRPWINTVHRQIDREGVRLYVRGGQPSDSGSFQRLC